ncbi:MAG: YybH family protein [Gammaproteobacteria bacterium]
MTFASPLEVEQAFYNAFEQADVEDMMTLWSPVGDVVCVHPMGPALTNLDMIRTSWLEIFAAPVMHEIEVELLSETRVNDLVVRTVMENFSVPGRNEIFPPVFATNVFWRGESGWYIAGHHASPGQLNERTVADPAATKH